MINKFLPKKEELMPIVDQIRTVLTEQGHADVLGTVIQNMRINSEMHAKVGVDNWLSYGVYLPSIERIFALHSGELEQDFMKRTQYPINVIEAYTVKGDDLATLVAADQYSQAHKLTVIKNNAVWCLNDEEQEYIDLNQYENRLRALY